MGVCASFRDHCTTIILEVKRIFGNYYVGILRKKFITRLHRYDSKVLKITPPCVKNKTAALGSTVLQLYTPISREGTVAAPGRTHSHRMLSYFARQLPPV